MSPQSEAKTRWDKEHTVTVTMKLNKRQDADIIEKLNSVDSKQGYIKELIKADKWIPCSERLPEEYGEYLVSVIYDNEPYVTTDDYYSYGWDDWGQEVIAWKNKPKAYIGKEDAK